MKIAFVKIVKLLGVFVQIFVLMFFLMLVIQPYVQAQGVAGSPCGTGQQDCGAGLSCSGVNKLCAPACTLDTDCGSSSMYCDVSGGLSNGACIQKSSPNQTGGLTGTTNGVTNGAGGQPIGACPTGLNWDTSAHICLPPNTTTCGDNGIACSSSLGDLMVKVITILLTISGVISVVFLIIGGFWYMTAAGNAEQAEKGKSTITNFFLGLVIIVMAYAIVKIVTSLFIQGK